MEFIIIQTFNGLSYGAVIFLLASGLSIIFGVMKIVNLAHASYYLVGGYVGLTINQITGNFYLAILGSILIVITFAILMERFFLRGLRDNLLRQVLMTVGFLFFFQDLCLVIWGGNPRSVKPPSYLTASLNIGPYVFPEFRMFLIVLALGVAIGLWLLQEKTMFGAQLRASVDDNEMAKGVGIKLPVIYSKAFALGGGLAALSGVVGSAHFSVYPGVDFEVLIYSVVAVIIGGLGSLRGAFVGAMILGLIDNFGKAVFPELSYFSLFAPMVLILSLRPTGLFGRAT